MSVIPGLPQRAARPRPQGAVIIPFPVPPTMSRRCVGPARRPPRHVVEGVDEGAVGGVRMPLRLTRRGRIVVAVATVLLVAVFLVAVDALLSAHRV